jgi:predicted RNase H-like HicB family nuclease
MEVLENFMSQHTYTVIYEQDPESGRYTASVPALRCVTEADTLDDAKVMAKEIIELELAALREKGLPIPVERTPPPMPHIERIAVGAP